MKLFSLFKRKENSTIKLLKNQLFAIRGKNIEIRCLYGDLWITWPKWGERILKSGQTFRVSSRGKICIVALSNAFFQMSKKRWVASAHLHKLSDVKNDDTDFFPILYETPRFIHPTEKA